MRNTLIFLIIVLSCMTSKQPVLAAEGSPSGREQSPMLQEKEMHMRQFQIFSLDGLLGRGIENGDGEELGKVSDAIIDQQSGQVVYLVVTTGDTLGMGGEKRAVPFKAMFIGYQGSLMLDLSKEQFNRAPVKPENLADRQWERQVHQFFGVAPYWEMGGREMQKVAGE